MTASDEAALATAPSFPTSIGVSTTETITAPGSRAPQSDGMDVFQTVEHNADYSSLSL
jgi:hypothetical protein